MTRFAWDDYDEEFPNQGALWWANVYRHVGGKAGREVLAELRDVLRAMPDKRLIQGRLANEEGCVCTVGAIVLARRVSRGEDRNVVLAEMAATITDDDYDGADVTASAAAHVGMKYKMGWYLADLNDEIFWKLTPEERYDAVLRKLDTLLAA